MIKYYMPLVITIFSLFLATQTNSLFLRQVTAAPSTSSDLTETLQAGTSGLQYASLSALAFMPVNQNATYRKDVRRQLLSLTNQTRNFAPESNLFIAPLILPDRSWLTGLTVFGEDFDNSGEVRLRLQRCDHGQARCLAIAETTSTASFAAGPFETAKVAIPNEVIDNNLFSYFLELELTALANSGLRSVRLELGSQSGPPVLPPGNVQRWSLADTTTSFLISTGDIKRVVRICTDDLSHLPNSTHYPVLIVDDTTTALSSNTCVEASGYTIELRRGVSTGPSSGTYQFLR